MIIPILRQTPFNFSYLAGGASEEVVVADRVPVSKGKTVNLSVRIHRITLASGATFQFLLFGSNPSQTDGTNFTTSPATIASTSLIAGASPNLVSLSSVLSEPVHPFVRIVMRASGPSATGTVYAELSADLVVRWNVPPSPFVPDLKTPQETDPFYACCYNCQGNSCGACFDVPFWKKCGQLATKAKCKLINSEPVCKPVNLPDDQDFQYNGRSPRGGCSG